jgi:hypothetical protein
MRVIKNQDDVRLLKEAKAISQPFAKHITKFFDDLQADLEDMSPNTYRLEDTGHVVLLEAGDNVRDLKEIGLNHQEQGILGCIPEWFETMTLDGVEYYRFLVLYNDSFGVVFFSAVGAFDHEVEAWLAMKLEEYKDL